MDTWAGLACIESDEFEVQYEVVSINSTNDREREISEGIADIDRTQRTLELKLNEYNKEIDRLTNHADGIDYAIAVTSGVISGIIDSTVVGEWDFEKAKSNANKDINNKVVQFAKKDPRYMPWCEGVDRTNKWQKRDSNRLESAIEFLEEKYHLPGDGAYKTGNFGIDGYTHRLDDLCHHPTLVGLVCCVIVQFTGSTKYVNKLGEDINIPITINEYGNFVGRNPVTKMFAGIINWFIICAKTIANRKGHLMSDIATPASLPGGFLSTITELASISCFRDADFLKKLRDAYVHGIGTKNSQIDLGAFNALFEGASNKFDVKTETAVTNELKRQAMPVVINEVLVRGAYFIRHLIKELKNTNDVARVDWNSVIPFNNRTIVRMMTIASGTFTAIDLADASVRSAIKSGGIANPMFFKNMILRVNFVGIGRFAIAVATDVSMEVKKEYTKRKCGQIISQMISLSNAKFYYVNADLLCEYAKLFDNEADMHAAEANLWIQYGNTQQAFQELSNYAEKVANFYLQSNERYYNGIDSIAQSYIKMKDNNPEFANEFLRRLES